MARFLPAGCSFASALALSGAGVRAVDDITDDDGRQARDDNGFASMQERRRESDGRCGIPSAPVQGMNVAIRVRRPGEEEGL